MCIHRRGFHCTVGAQLSLSCSESGTSPSPSCYRAQWVVFFCFLHIWLCGKSSDFGPSAGTNGHMRSWGFFSKMQWKRQTTDTLFSRQDNKPALKIHPRNETFPEGSQREFSNLAQSSYCIHAKGSPGDKNQGILNINFLLGISTHL